jgi:hypothetical protein
MRSMPEVKTGLFASTRTAVPEVLEHRRMDVRLPASA